MDCLIFLSVILALIALYVCYELYASCRYSQQTLRKLDKEINDLKGRLSKVERIDDM
jgi:hypothetical protein